MPVAENEYQHDGHMYCAEQINIPVTLPNILKSYAKAAIRTQPYDLLNWTAAYFRALADGLLPPVKARLEYPPNVHPSGITPHFLKALLNQYSYDEENANKRIGFAKKTSTPMFHVTLESLLRRWRGMALSDSSLYQILVSGRLLRLPPQGSFPVCDLYRFLAIACALLGNSLLETMIYVCELLTDEPEGGSGMIPLRTFMRLYEYLADLDSSANQSIIETGTASILQGEDEASLLRSTSSSPSYVPPHSHSNASSRILKIQTIINGSSSGDAEPEKSLLEVSEEEELASGSKARSCQWSDSEKLEAREALAAAAAVRPLQNERWSRSGLDATKAISISGSETTRIPQLESRMPSERSTPDEKEKKKNTKKNNRKKKRELPEGNVGEHGGSANAEVTKVQEARRRRRDVEVHSSTEKASPVDDENATEQLLLDSTDASSSSSSLSSSLNKSHVGFPEPVKAAFASASREHGPETDKILATRSLELLQELEQEPRKVSSPNGTHNISRQASITARNDNSHPSNIKQKITHKSDARKKQKGYKNTKANTMDIPRDSFEYDDPTSDEQVGGDEKSSRGQRQSKNSLERTEKVDSVDVADDEDSSEANENEAEPCSEGEQVEDMADYEPIGLENVLQGLCGCHKPRRETTDPAIPVSASAPKLDPVLEFIEKMKAEHSAGRLLLPEVPGIGPRVSPKRVTEVGLWLGDCARRQQGYVAPRNLRHFLCPNLQEDTPYEDYYRTKTMCA